VMLSGSLFARPRAPAPIGKDDIADEAWSGVRFGED
jgi:hypothetical protein